MKKDNKEIDILCIGEVLIDFIGHQSDVLINNTRDYHRYLGGSPTNVAMNTARLGLKPIMISSVGNDGFGEYILKRLNEVNVNTEYIKKLDDKATSVIFVSKSKGTPDFIPFRQADSYITEDQITTDTLTNTKIFHTTCFALSKGPAQATILKKAEEAFNLGCKLSIDLNYAKKLWKSQEEALEVIKTYCSFNPLIKISEDDMLRLFEKELAHQEIFEFFHNLGVETVCLTLGENGVKLSEKNKKIIQLPAIKVEKVIDTTGAGDAFWSGFLFAYIKEKPIQECLEIALKLAALKLQNVGRLPENINILSKLL
ncbi:carbohydrate kinase [Polaribacter reichenbachii]|uniref:Carbohydrate kinase n=1 Tax=Polaribacter reichenbachii TaxID=996801 RepID=A0A1B8U745_9FLAO|nr:carbohydrate kinase [Polaribacter reichenbachii]APZ46340.1 carbohydrate kinase [Polaribacter reichenbachii]AUC20204.1 carbohydrate kinase [Polaribacter reichenbachii]OBY67705.1 carbohydrate kinase [Polaribacter reichenbachii]